jgi:hypothetical protein
METFKKNPFEFEGANNLSDDEILEFYIEDYNYSRFILSPRNIFLIGERGTGKTMALLYNSFKIRYKYFKKNNLNIDYKYIGIHIPCKSPLFDKREYLLLQDDFKASVISEHYLVLSIVSSIASSLSEIPEILNSEKEIDNDLKMEFEYYLDIKLDENVSFLKSVRKFVDKEVINTQKKVNNLSYDEFYKDSLSFSTLIIPFLNCLKKIDILSESNFLLMIDDEQDLNKYQIRSINSWIAYRDHSYFSFKVASGKINRPELITSTGGTILEGHDFTEIEMEKYFYNKDSDFAKLAKEILHKRLLSVGIRTSPEEFFPVNSEFLKDLRESEEIVRKIAIEKYNDDKKKISDYVYKYARAHYFKNKDPKSNLPPYSGIETIIDISTGIVRNLLDPCYWMFDSALSNISNDFNIIPASIQTEIIKSRSDFIWERLMVSGLDKEIEGCTKEDSKRIYQFLDNLMNLLSERLHKHESLPRAIEFYISQKGDEVMKEILPLLVISQKAQILYTRISSGKEKGKKEIYYIPNRMLLPTRGLDPKGQHDRVSLKAVDIWKAAFKNKPFPYNYEPDEENQIKIEYE